MLKYFNNVAIMNKKIDFSKLTNAEINIKLINYENEYDLKKNKIIELIHELEDLDALYIKGKGELEKRGILTDGH